MSQIESFANSGGSPEPLEVLTPTMAVVCTPAVFAGAFVGIGVNYAFDKAVDWYVARHGGGHFEAVGDGHVPAGEMSGDELLGLLAARF
ncbi:hypothetical protein [Amycolatopsis tolypomycina]|uniref:Uncharacterized protein n=1 Tax=Amycolatopsis tolypomycina TaxID=208445 RepID=A0A1H4T175_9PSEU|nr:hypothetical protein [Amycolatopsis tolypomycina]SEC50223.1 hypothetical protein SAMN04489727_3988 [Amycolatopsis tolypomycina]